MNNEGDVRILKASHRVNSSLAGHEYSAKADGSLQFLLIAIDHTDQ